MAAIQYKPPPTIRDFIVDYLPGEHFYDWIIGPVGSGKTTGIFFKLAFMAKLQEPGPDGIRRTRAVIVRNTSTQLRDTTLNSWFTWFKDGQAGHWQATNKNFILKFDDVECEVMFRPLDTPDDVARVLSLEVTFAIIDEFVEIPKQIIEALAARCGRYPSALEGGATNWGMWGSSNPSTEDNWWFDYLHDPDINIEPDVTDLTAERAKKVLQNNEMVTRNSRYFKQPSGWSDEAENVENLPGGRKYYDNQAKGKSEAWVKQYIEAEWGFSISGKAVVQTFKPEIHVSNTPLLFNPHLELVGGYDPGLGGAAMIFGQEDLDGRLWVLGEIITVGVGSERFMTEKMRPYMRRRFKDIDLNKFTVAPDPAAANRSANDEKAIVATIRKHYNVSIESNNRLPLRLDAIDYYATRLVDGKPALMIDGTCCPVLVRALKGGWRYALDAKEEMKSEMPEKNQYSHPGDGFGYLARYFHRQANRNARYERAGVKPFVPPRRFSPSYHMR